MRLVFLAAFLVLAACRPESGEEAREAVARWLYPGEELAFGSGRRCTAAAFRLNQPFLRAEAIQVSDADQAVWHIAQGEAVAMRDARLSPDGLSRVLVAADLAAGAALISAVTAPRPCMGEAMTQGAGDLMTTPGAVLIYDGRARVVVIADLGRGVALYLRSRD
ncbi:hypothetical protein [Histidinibacterium lentulum]|uniref:Lipoprotein n=1 Tax=Histidinibacterium lentulum TaxID=2480588 RepID=A0A3N2QM56_9RHOB|nr:hypothetical protein [Histidinibacterium lentulum]ROT96281.1 hypothetical protein EAT49_18750 [Histidinibacterium lentulum]